MSIFKNNLQLFPFQASILAHNWRKQGGHVTIEQDKEVGDIIAWGSKKKGDKEAIWKWIGDEYELLHDFKGNELFNLLKEPKRGTKIKPIRESVVTDSDTISGFENDDIKKINIRFDSNFSDRAQSTSKTFKDGVPVMKDFNKLSKVSLPKGDHTAFADLYHEKVYIKHKDKWWSFDLHDIVMADDSDNLYDYRESNEAAQATLDNTPGMGAISFSGDPGSMTDFASQEVGSGDKSDDEDDLEISTEIPEKPVALFTTFESFINYKIEERLDTKKYAYKVSKLKDKDLEDKYMKMSKTMKLIGSKDLSDEEEIFQTMFGIISKELKKRPSLSESTFNIGWEMLFENIAIEDYQSLNESSKLKSEVIKETEFYVLKKELHDMTEYGGANEPPMEMTSAYSVIDGSFIGDEKTAQMLEKKGIKAQRIDEDHNVASIGYSESDQKWYGWSHRAIYGFKEGMEVKKGDCAYQPSCKEDLIENMKEFWGVGKKPEKNHKLKGVEKDVIDEDHNGLSGFRITYESTDINGNVLKSSHFTPYPKTWGRGEYIITNENEAKETAINFAKSVS